MKIQSFVCTVMLGLLVFAGDALAKGPGSGPGGGGDDVGSPPDYGDLVKLYRDADGVPFPSPVVDVTDPETGETVDGGQCWQPLAFNTEDETLCPAECVIASIPSGAYVVDVDQYSCAIAEGCAGCTQEVDFGRMNDARAPDSVYTSQLDDVIVNLATAGCVDLDPAGRLVYSSAVYNGEVIESVSTSTVDSPLQNLAIYKELMLNGDGGILNGLLPAGASVLDTAARALGAASDKSGGVDMDLVSYLNQIMGLDEAVTFLDKSCENFREEVMGNVELVTKCFLLYDDDAGPYAYSRRGNFDALPAPPYVPVASGEAGQPGYFEVLVAELPLATNPFNQTFGILRGPIFDTVFGEGNHAGSGSGAAYGIAGIGDFAQAADDARAVIDYMHSWPLPADYATPFDTCTTAGAGYDFSISEESGLQVPIQMVDGSEREFIVTVAGGDDTTPFTVTVTATPENGDVIADSPWEFNFPNEDNSKSFTQLFTVNLGAKTVINWRATVTSANDVNPNNDTVTATTSIRTTSGRGGGGEL